ncbi:hypothetical protein Taro_011595 [Colocasia esculenta]|uniref:Protein FAR1-RELATED SEQUENCE n=1 Tax=Colocasia esculenta TaxID=4460 RepID=A0A843U6B7_COLES|nr:hypothetical protein [Colocasia esculenta]
MSTSQRSESIHHFFDGFVTTKTTLSEFVTKYVMSIECRFEAENHANLKSLDTEAYLRTSSPFEKQAAGIYTRSMFNKFQHELLEGAGCQPQFIEANGPCVTLRLKSFERVQIKGVTKDLQKMNTVTYNKDSAEVECTCRSFQFRGYLCRHAMWALQYCGVEKIPDKYFLNRWRKDLRYREGLEASVVREEDRKHPSSRYTILIYRLMKVAQEASSFESQFDHLLAEIPNILLNVMQSKKVTSVQIDNRNAQHNAPERTV